MRLSRIVPIKREIKFIVNVNVRGIWRRGSGTGDREGRFGKRLGDEKHGGSGGRGIEPVPACIYRRDPM